MSGLVEAATPSGANGIVLPERLAVTTFIPSAWPCVEVLLPRVDEVVRSR